MFLNQNIFPPFLNGLSVIFFGGDSNLIGRSTNWAPDKKNFDAPQIMSEADLRIIDLNCVLAAQGKQGIDKGTPSPYYYHARPEEVNLLKDAAIDVVLTANDHSLDYYEAALLEQNNYLDRAGILHCGTGKNVEAAAAPLFIKVNDLVVALFNVDGTTKNYSATASRAGTFYLPIEQPELWKKFFAEKIADARKKADVVLVAPHWYPNSATGIRAQARTVGRLLIDCGADAVVGYYFNFKNGVETYKQRPIIYNMGNFLFDAQAGIGGGYSLLISKRGVEQIFFTPFPTNLNEPSKLKVCEIFLNSCNNLNTSGKYLGGGLIELSFNPPQRAEKILEPVELSTPTDGEKIPPMTEPLPQWTTDNVPDDALIEPQQFGDLKLIGCRIAQDSLIMRKRQLLYVETWWTIDEPTDKDLTFLLQAVPSLKDSMPNFGRGMEHKACDWLYPTNRWKKGVIYYERIGLRPPLLRDMVNAQLSLEVSVLDGKLELGKYIHPKKMQLRIAHSSPVDLTEPLSGNFDIEVFKRKFKENNGVIFFMLRHIKPKGSGLEGSSFRRAKMFRKSFGLEVNLVTNEYQNDLLEQRDNYNMDVRVLNMYDYFQGINRDKEKPRRTFIAPMKDGWRVERTERDLRIYDEKNVLKMYCVYLLRGQRLSYINYFAEDGRTKIRRDWYDALGFLSRRQELDEKGMPTEVFYYRPDGSVAIYEVYETVNDKSTLKVMELIDRGGSVTNSFKIVEDAHSYFLRQLVNDKNKTYFLIGDRTPDWHRAYTAINLMGLENVHVFHQLHNIHVLEPFDPATSKLKNRYRYIENAEIKTDVILSLTNRQQRDIINRYKLKNVVVLPHSLAAVPRVIDVKLNPFKIIQVGRIVEEKGHEQSILAMKKVLEKVPQATLHFYGQGSYQKVLQKIIDENNLGDHIKFEGFSENMPAEFASAAMSVLPSHFEGFPLVVQESLQQGCPVVAFDCNYGPEDGIEDGVNGYLIPVDDVDALADRMIKILSEEGLREKLSSNCVKSVEKFYPEVISKKWAELFCKFMK